jgi:hypothetical protein
MYVVSYSIQVSDNYPIIGVGIRLFCVVLLFCEYLAKNVLCTYINASTFSALSWLQMLIFIFQVFIVHYLCVIV